MLGQESSRVVDRPEVLLFEGGFGDHRTDKCHRTLHALFIKNGTQTLIEKMTSGPCKIHRLVLFRQSQLELPELLLLEIIDSPILVDNETEGRELTGPYERGT